MAFIPVFHPNTTLAFDPFGNPVIVGHGPVAVAIDPFGRPAAVVASPMVVQTTTISSSSSGNQQRIPPIDEKCCIKDPNDPGNYKQLNEDQWKAVHLSKRNNRRQSWQYNVDGKNFHLRRQTNSRGKKFIQIKEGRGNWTTLYFFNKTYNPPYYHF